MEPPTKKNVPTLDLHGYYRERAIQELVAFLERLSTWEQQKEAMIITGMGKHSHLSGGPVLKTAVEKFLTVHQFQFTYRKGCFHIQVSTGSLRNYQQCSDVDTKIILMDDPSVILQETQTTRKRTYGRSKSQVGQAAGGREAHETNDTMAGILMGPSVTEVAREEGEIQKGKEESLVTFRQYIKVKHREHKELEKALQLSEQHKQQQQQQQQPSISDEDEHQILQQTLEVSAREEASLRQQEEQMLQQALELSEREISSHSRHHDEYEECLQQVIEQSRQDTRTSAISLESNEESITLQRVLELSVRETTATTSEFIGEDDELILAKLLSQN
jgi:hypothetical protein